jgi:hypothetical protein
MFFLTFANLGQPVPTKWMYVDLQKNCLLFSAAVRKQSSFERALGLQPRFAQASSTITNG